MLNNLKRFYKGQIHEAETTCAFTYAPTSISFPLECTLVPFLRFIMIYDYHTLGLVRVSLAPGNIISSFLFHRTTLLSEHMPYYLIDTVTINWLPYTSIIFVTTVNLWIWAARGLRGFRERRTRVVLCTRRHSTDGALDYVKQLTASLKSHTLLSYLNLRIVRHWNLLLWYNSVCSLNILHLQY